MVVPIEALDTIKQNLVRRLLKNIREISPKERNERRVQIVSPKSFFQTFANRTNLRPVNARRSHHWALAKSQEPTFPRLPMDSIP
jgi:hypothetical protein